MNKYIEIISQLRPKNNQTFPIADANDLIGGYMQVANLSELNSINTAKRRKGMLCYVDSEDKIYKYTGSSWKELTVGGNSSVYHLEYPGVENSDNLQLTEEQYNDIASSDLIVINNKYVVIAKEILNNQQIYICKLTAILNYRQQIVIDISFDYMVQSSIVDIFDNIISQSTGDSSKEVMSQSAVTQELNRKQDKFDIGKGLELTDGILWCTLDTSIYVIVGELPVDGLPNKIYLVNNHSSENRNIYSEYIWVGSQWELLGTYQATIDLEDYVTKSTLDSAIASVNRQLDALDFKVNNIPVVPIQKTYYEITEVGQLEGIPEGSVVYFQQYLEGENVTYGSFQWIDDVSGFICYTETSNDASTIYSDPNMIYPVYSGQEYKKEIVQEGQTPILYIRTTDDIQIHRCTYNGQYVGPVQYYPGFYIKTSSALKKIASSEDIPVKNSQLENDSKFINTINYKKSSNGEIIIDGNDINVSGEYIVPDIVGGGGEEVQYSGSVNDAVLELFGANEEQYAHIDNLYTNVQAIYEDIQDLQDNKLDKDDLPAPETYILNFTIADGVNTGSYDTTEYANLLAAIKEGKLVIVKGGATRVTADSQAVADKDAYVVIRYSTPRISDDNKSITISFYELKFGDIDSSGQCKYQSKAIHKTI